MYTFVIIIILLHFRFSLYYCTAWVILTNMRITASQWREQHKRARRRIKFQWRKGYLEISCHLTCNWIEHKWIRAQIGHKRASVDNRKKENKSLHSSLQYFIARHGRNVWYVPKESCVKFYSWQSSIILWLNLLMKHELKRYSGRIRAPIWLHAHKTCFSQSQYCMWLPWGMFCHSDKHLLQLMRRRWFSGTVPTDTLHFIQYTFYGRQNIIMSGEFAVHGKVSVRACWSSARTTLAMWGRALSCWSYSGYGPRAAEHSSRCPCSSCVLNEMNVTGLYWC